MKTRVEKKYPDLSPVQNRSDEFGHQWDKKDNRHFFTGNVELCYADTGLHCFADDYG